MATRSTGTARPKRAKAATGDAQSPAVTASQESARPISPEQRRSLYAASHYLSTDLERAFGLQIPFVVFLQDPKFARDHPELGVNETIEVRWEPGLSDGPTSARFAVVDFNGDTGQLASPARWDGKLQQFVDGRTVLNQTDAANLQFHQVNTWALLQRALAFFEEGSGLGRPIPWAFEGNRLIVVPHAGYGENAFYDRRSKSLQFYYFGSEDDTVYTCLSSDIVSHEFGHAVLDGIRPYFNESASVQTAAFHEFVGDLTAILITLRNNEFRKWLARKTRGDMSKAQALSSIAEQFGDAVQGKPYLRSAQDQGQTKATMAEVADSPSPHRVSEVLTKAMFDILMRLAQHYAEVRGRTPAQAFWDVAQRMQRMAIQPLDLLPPVEVTFRDYALAVVRAEELSNPLDPYDYRALLIKAFCDRGILDSGDEAELAKPRYLYDRPELLVFHDIDAIARSRAGAYQFLNDNRDELLIPALQDIVVADLYDAQKCTRQGNRLPRQIILEYIWREEVSLDGTQYGKFNGQSTTMLCGGTLAFDDTGTLLSWMRKPGTVGRTLPSGKRADSNLGRAWEAEVTAGVARRDELLRAIARQIAAGRVGLGGDGDHGLLGSRLAPLTAEFDGALVRFQLSPHLNLSEGDEDDEGERQWELSC